MAHQEACTVSGAESETVTSRAAVSKDIALTMPGTSASCETDQRTSAEIAKLLHILTIIKNRRHTKVKLPTADLCPHLPDLQNGRRL